MVMVYSLGMGTASRYVIKISERIAPSNELVRLPLFLFGAQKIGLTISGGYDTLV